MRRGKKNRLKSCCREALRRFRGSQCEQAGIALAAGRVAAGQCGNEVNHGIARAWHRDAPFCRFRGSNEASAISRRPPDHRRWRYRCERSTGALASETRVIEGSRPRAIGATAEAIHSACYPSPPRSIQALAQPRSVPSPRSLGPPSKSVGPISNVGGINTFPQAKAGEVESSGRDVRGRCIIDSFRSTFRRIPETLWGDPAAPKRQAIKRIQGCSKQARQ